jgi:prepilin-type N-terminal cleavage/methylation domain-containing protein
VNWDRTGNAHNHERGFSLFEIVLVVVIISILAAVGLKHYTDISDAARKTGFLSQARIFAAAIQSARAVWMLKKHNGRVPTQPGIKLSVDLDGERIFVNENGWPANTSPELDSSIETQTAAECYELWFGLMSHPIPATVEGIDSPQSDNIRYHVSRSVNACRYELQTTLDDVYLFDYDLETGKVVTNILTAQ